MKCAILSIVNERISNLEYVKKLKNTAKEGEKY
jgi:hypothetical protein